MSSVASNKQRLHRLLDEVWNGRNLAVIPELYRADFVADYRPYAPLRHGHDGVRAMVEGAVAAFPDYREDLLGLVGEGANVVAHLRICGTQLGAWGPLPATGRALVFEEMLWLTFHDDGRVATQRGIVDNLLALRQAGAIPNPRSPRNA